MWAHLSQPELVAEDPAYCDAVRRALARLGEYIEIIVRPLNMRPVGASILAISRDRVEVRVTSSSSHIVIAIGPDADLAGEIFWLRTMATRNLAAHRLISHDQSGARVPFSYAILSFLGGAALVNTADSALVRVAARATGRTLRRAHQVIAPGFGRPTPSGRWLSNSWPMVLRAWLDSTEALTLATHTFDSETYAALLAATLEHPDLACETPCLLHGAIGPARILVTSGESIQLEALTCPGPIVAGDPLLDVATALLPSQPAAFRQGFLEGYAAVGPLDQSQRLRLRRLGVLAMLANAATQPDPAILANLPALVRSELRMIGG
ncbi:MAG: phosphotransferase [Roseiflexaceae bacterium]|nr:phosphotransferase [Roseiflexaceae bacterium]